MLLLSLQNTNTKIVHASLSKRYLPYTYLLYVCLFVCVFKSNKNIFKCITNKQEDKNDKENLNWKLLIRFADVQLSLWGVGGTGRSLHDPHYKLYIFNIGYSFCL